MDVMKAFEEWLPIWSEEKHLPIPTKAHMDKWLEAWKDFLSEYMLDNYEQVADEYRNMKYKGEEESTQILPEVVEEVEEEKPKKSNWELVQERMKNRNCKES